MITDPAARAAAQASLDAAPTLLEKLFWAMTLGGSQKHYFQELLSCDLRGPGCLTDNEPGEPDLEIEEDEG